MLDKQKVDRIELAFFLSYVGAIAFALLSFTFTPGFWGGIFGGLCISSVYAGLRMLLWAQSR